MKPYISSFTYCESIQAQATPQGDQTQIVGPLQVLNPLVVPSHFSFSIAFGIVGIVPEQENILVLKIQSPTGDEIYATPEVHLNMPSNSDGIRKVSTLQFNLDLRNLFFAVEGTYRTTVSLNGVIMGEYPIEVLAGGVR